MARFTGSRVPPHTKPNRGKVRRIAAATAAGLVITLAQMPAGAATGVTNTGPNFSLPAGSPAVASPEQQEIDAAAEEARDTGERVELESAREADTTVFIEPSG